LGTNLLDRYAGRTMSMKQVFDDHNVGTPFIERNYKKVLGQMEAAGQIVANPPASARPTRNGERTFSDRTSVTFPRKVA
jgi:hypothetical protein